MTIIELAIEKGVTVSDITSIAREWGRVVGPNQKLNDGEVSIISARLAEMTIPVLNSYFGNIENRFKRISQRVHFNEYPILASHFSDEEAQKLCLRLFDKQTFALAKKFSNDKTNPEIKYSLHKVAENCLKCYGGLLLSFVLSLKILSDPNPETQIYSSDTNPDFSLRDIVFRDENNDELVITFRRLLAFRQPSNFGFAVSKVKGSGQREILYCFSPTGLLIENFVNRTPQLNLFFNQYTNGGTFYFGHSSSNCFICGKELLDPHSIIYGVGPTCRANFPLYFL